MRKFIKKPIVIIVFLIIIIISVWWYWRYGDQTESIYESVTVERRLVAQEVNVTGRVKPVEEVNLAFERGGKIARVNVKIGDIVTVGQALVESDTSELGTELDKAEAALRSAIANRSQYQAGLETQRAKLEELKRGARPEEISVSETKVLSAKQVLADAEQNLVNTTHQASVDLSNLYGSVPNILNDAYAKVEDAVNKQVDDFFTDDNSNPKLTFTTSNSQAQIDVEQQRLILTAMLASFRSDLDSLKTDDLSLDAAMIRSLSRLIVARDFMTRLTDTINTSTSLSQTTAATYKGYINTARTNINTAITAISGQQQSVASKKAVNKDSIDAAEAKVSQAQNSLSLAESELALKRAGPTAEQLRAKEAEVRQSEATLNSQEAAVAEARATMDNLYAQIAKTIIRSTINGVVTKQEAEVGEIVTANTPIVSVISAAKLEIEADIPEVDIAKLKIGNSAEVTLDAYGDDARFAAAVVSIDPAEKLIEGVATYKAKLQFMNDDSRIKPGMTANVTVVGEKRNNVIAVPQRAVLHKGDYKAVEVIENGALREVSVKIGLRSSDGYFEIIDGLKEGDQVVVSSK